MSPNPRLGLGSGAVEKRRNRYSKAARSTGTLVAREAMDAIMVYVLLFPFHTVNLFFSFFVREDGRGLSYHPVSISNPP